MRRIIGRLLLELLWGGLMAAGALVSARYAITCALDHQYGWMLVEVAIFTVLFRTAARSVSEIRDLWRERSWHR